MRERQARPIRALVLDLDGTLVDTEKLYRRFWVEAARHFGYPMEDKHALMLRSLGPAYAEPMLRREVWPTFDYFAVRSYRRKIMGDYLETHAVEEKPGMRELLITAQALRVKIALATATPKERAEGVLRRLGVLEAFDFLACGDMVDMGKPNPALYFLAAKGLGVAPEEAMGVEDAPAGIQASHDAGCFTVMVPDQDEPNEETLRLCDAVERTLGEVAVLLTGLAGREGPNQNSSICRAT